MYKAFASSSWNLDRPVTSRIKLSSRGLIGEDRSAMVKRAGKSILDAIPLLKSGEIGVHMIGVSADEHYGCFAAGTSIALEDGSYIDVADVAEEDVVLSAEGRGRAVTATFKREVTSGLVLDVAGLTYPLKCSEDHPFRVARFEQFQCDHDKYKRCLPPLQGNQNICNRTKAVRLCAIETYREIVTEWSAADEVRTGDFLVWTCPKIEPPRNIGVDEGYLIGAWLAEGCFIRNRSNKAVAGLRLSININEQAFTEALETAVVRCGMTTNIYDGSADRGERVVFIHGNPPRCREYFSWFGEYALHKHLPPWVCCLPRETRMAIVAGYMDGDGSCQVSDKENRTTARSHGRDLALGMQRLLWSLDSPATVCPVEPGEDRNNTGYNISFANSSMSDLVRYSWKFRPRELKQTTKVHGFSHRGRMYMPVRTVTRVVEPFEVYNFEVDEDHTYSGPNVDSHNCNRNGDGFDVDTLTKRSHTFLSDAMAYREHLNRDRAKSYGRVVYAAYNPDAGWTDLVVGYNGTKEAADRNGGLLADKEMEILDRGDDIPVSMSCHLPFDVCAKCANRAKNRGEYCDDRPVYLSDRTVAECPSGGVRRYMMKVCSDGHVNRVLNPGCTFFDISNVSSPAGHICYTTGVLAKAASARQQLSGVELAYLYGMGDDVMPALALDPAASPEAAVTLRLIDAEAGAVKSASLDPAIACEHNTPVEWRSVAHCVGPALQALASAGVVLPPDLWLAAISGVSKSAAVVAAESLRGQMSDIFGSAGTRIAARAAAYRPTGCPGPELRRWAAKVATAYGMDDSVVSVRARRAVLDGLELQLNPVTVTKSASVTVRALAEEYAAYQVAAVTAITANGNSGFTVLPYLLARRNALL
jgi:hypothetical protein